MNHNKWVKKSNLVGDWQHIAQIIWLLSSSCVNIHRNIIATQTQLDATSIKYPSSVLLSPSVPWLELGHYFIQHAYIREFLSQTCQYFAINNNNLYNTSIITATLRIKASFIQHQYTLHNFSKVNQNYQNIKQQQQQWKRKQILWIW